MFGLGGHVCKTTWRDQTCYKSNRVDAETSPNNLFVFFWILRFNFFLADYDFKSVSSSYVFLKRLHTNGQLFEMGILGC